MSPSNNRSRRATPLNGARRRLSDIRTQFQIDGDVRALLNAVLMAAIEATSAQFGNIQIVDAGDGGLRIVAQHGFEQEFLDFFRYVREDKSACSATLHARRHTIATDVRESRVFTEPARRIMLRANVRACQSTPIMSSTGQVLGIISTHFRMPRRPTRGELASVDALAESVADIIESSLPAGASVELVRAVAAAAPSTPVAPQVLLRDIQRMLKRGEASQQSARPIQSAHELRFAPRAKAHLRTQAAPARRRS